MILAADRIIAAGGEPASLERAVSAKATALIALDKKDEGLATLDAFVAKAPDSAAAQVARAQCLAALGKNEEARAAVEKALVLDPGNLMALDLRFWPTERGDIALIQQAVAPLVEYAEKHPAVPGVWRSLARMKLAVGSTDEALQLFAKAVDLSPSDDDLRAEYWSELAKQARFQEVLDDAAKITDMNKRDWKLRWSEAEAYRGLGRKQEANGAFTGIATTTSRSTSTSASARSAPRSRRWARSERRSS